MAERSWGNLSEAPIVKLLEGLSTICQKALQLRANQQALQGLMQLKSIKYSEQKRLDSVRAHMAKTEA